MRTRLFFFFLGTAGYAQKRVPTCQARPFLPLPPGTRHSSASAAFCECGPPGGRSGSLEPLHFPDHARVSSPLHFSDCARVSSPPQQIAFLKVYVTDRAPLTQDELDGTAADAIRMRHEGDAVRGRRPCAYQLKGYNASRKGFPAKRTY